MEHHGNNKMGHAKRILLFLCLSLYFTNSLALMRIQKRYADNTCSGPIVEYVFADAEPCVPTGCTQLSPTRYYSMK